MGVRMDHDRSGFSARRLTQFLSESHRARRFQITGDGAHFVLMGRMPDGTAATSYRDRSFPANLPAWRKARIWHAIQFEFITLEDAIKLERSTVGTSRRLAARSPADRGPAKSASAA